MPTKTTKKRVRRGEKKKKAVNLQKQFTDYGISDEQAQDIEKRFTYHPPNVDQASRYLIIRSVAKELMKTITRFCPESREKSIAFAALEETVMWANASIARNEYYIPHLGRSVRK